MAHESGTCGFCGFGEGWLGGMGDEGTQRIHGAIRVGEPGYWKYEKHPNADQTGMVTWCGNCLSGLAHKFQRYDDHNLNAKLLADQFRLELDGPRWGAWEAVTPEDKAIAKKYQDDIYVHMEKLHLQREVHDMENETFRRAGFPLTLRGWRE